MTLYTPLSGTNTVNELVDRVNVVAQDVAALPPNIVDGPETSRLNKLPVFANTTGNSIKDDSAVVSDFAYTLLDDVSASAARITLDAQANNVNLTALSNVAGASNILPYFDTSTTIATTPLTAHGRSMLDDVDAAATRSTIGLGTMATQAATAVSISGGTITGITDLAIADGGTGASTAVAAKANLGMANVDNTSDANKPVSTAQQTALNLKANANNAALTGVPTAPTAAVNTNTTQIATTEYVISAFALADVTGAKINSPGFSGTPTAPTATPGTNTTQLATTEFVTTAVAPKLNSSEKGVPNGVATLDAGGLVPSSQLPAYVDDVLEFANLGAFPGTGATGKIYVALATNKTYRWSGSAYVYITSGAVDSVAGKTGVVTLVKADVGLGNVDNTTDAAKPVSTATATALGGKEPTITAGVASQFWSGTKAWVDFATTVRSTVLSGYTIGVNSAISASDTLLAALQKLEAQAQAGFARANHTGTQLASTISNFASEVVSTALTGFNLGSSAAVVATDSIVAGIGKLQAQINLSATNLMADVRATILTGLSTTTNSEITAADSNIIAMGKLQAQLTNINGTNITSGTIPAARIPTLNQNTSGNAATATTLTGLTSTVTELNYVNGVTSAIQTQLNGKAPLASPAFTGTPSGPTASPGTNTTQFATTAFVRASGFGVGQTWQNLTGSRAIGTTYTNSTGKPIEVSVSTTNSSNASTIAVTVAGVLIINDASSAGVCGVACFSVPDGATYSVASAKSLNLWAELR